MMLLALIASTSTMQVPLTDEVFIADEAVRLERKGMTLVAACVTKDASSPSYKLTYKQEQEDGSDGTNVALCVWRPWRVGTFIVDTDDEVPCACDNE